MTRAWHADHGRDHGPHGHDPTPAGPWHYASPLSPAPDPSDLIPVADDVASAAFKNGWANTTLSDGTTYSPLRWRFTSAGKKQIEGAIDGGALGTVCVTLPAEFWPAKDEVRVISSVDGSRAITVSISATNGDVTVIGFPQSAVTLSANQVTTSTIADGAVTEAKITLADNTTDDVTSTKHGFAPKSPADATKFLNGAATPAYAQVKDSDLSTSDITTNDVTTTKHGFVPKAPNDTSKFLRGDGAWAVAGSVSSVVANDAIWDAKGDLAVATGADAASRLAVGSDNQVLTADSSQTTGVKWATPSAGNTDGWTSDTSNTWTYVSATSFKRTGVDETAKFSKGTRLRLKQGGSYLYFVVVSSSFSTDTTVTITGGSDYMLANASITDNYYSYQINPQGYPGWFNYSASFTGWSSFTTNTAQFAVVGNNVFIELFANGTSNSTSASCSAPIAAASSGQNSMSFSFVGSNNGLTIQAFVFFTSSTNLQFRASVATAASWNASGTKVVGLAAHYSF